MEATASAGVEVAEVQVVEREWDGKRLPVALWGRDHFSTLLYIETTITDGKGDGYGRPHIARMRQEPGRPRRGHGRDEPGLGGVGGKRYPSRLGDGTALLGHDDWDCVDDMVAQGVMIREEEGGSGKFPIVKLTAFGRVYAASLREHLGNNGRRYAGFVPPERPADAPVPAPEKPMTVGDVWFVESSRKGKLVLRITKLDETWLTGDILDGTATAMNPDNIREVGETSPSAGRSSSRRSASTGPALRVSSCKQAAVVGPRDPPGVGSPTVQPGP